MRLGLRVVWCIGCVLYGEEYEVDECDKSEGYGGEWFMCKCGLWMCSVLFNVGYCWCEFFCW